MKSVNTIHLVIKTGKLPNNAHYQCGHAVVHCSLVEMIPGDIGKQPLKIIRIYSTLQQ